MSGFGDPIHADDAAARDRLEKLRWANGRFCPHCGETERTSPVGGEKHRPGLYHCNGCKGRFSVTVGTILERSRIPLHQLVLGFRLMAPSKKGVSAHQLHRTLHLRYKTAWFMAHRIRAAVDGADGGGPLGGEGKVVEADEAHSGNKDDATKRAKRGKPSLSDKRSVVALVERGGKARTFHVERADTVAEPLR